MSLLKNYIPKKGVKKSGNQEKNVVVKGMKQLHDRVMSGPIFRNDLNEQEKKRSTESLILLVQKQPGKIKSRTVANGITQRAYINRDDASSTTAASNAIIITGAI